MKSLWLSSDRDQFRRVFMALYLDDCLAPPCLVTEDMNGEEEHDNLGVHGRTKRLEKPGYVGRIRQGAMYKYDEIHMIRLRGYPGHSPKRHVRPASLPTAFINVHPNPEQPRTVGLHKAQFRYRGVVSSSPQFVCKNARSWAEEA